MKSLPIIFLGIFLAMALSWSIVVLTPHLQLKNVIPATEELVDDQGNPIGGAVFVANGEVHLGLNAEGDTTYPIPLVGEAQRGKLVYESMGCMYCHTQQVRRKGYGADYERGWGERQSVPRDYIEQDRVMLGSMRTGPDLTNVGLRYPEEWHYQHLYNAQITSNNGKNSSTMPPYPFLFEVREISETRGPSPDAVDMKEYNPGEGYEVVPTQRAKDLVAYLMNLKQDYELPEMKFSE
jgi:cytochrome c oxidase cbb3-type subunit 2